MVQAEPARSVAWNQLVDKSAAYREIAAGEGVTKCVSVRFEAGVMIRMSGLVKPGAVLSSDAPGPFAVPAKHLPFAGPSDPWQFPCAKKIHHRLLYQGVRALYCADYAFRYGFPVRQPCRELVLS